MKKKISLMLLMVLLLLSVFSFGIPGINADSVIEISFDTAGGSPVPDKVTYSSGDFFKAPQEPEKKGYEFIGWKAKNHPGTGFIISDNKDKKIYQVAGEFFYLPATEKNVEISGSIELIAIYKKKERLKVVFDAAGGSPVPSNQIFYVGETINEPIKPEKKGYNFIAWNVSGYEAPYTIINFDKKMTFSSEKNIFGISCKDINGNEKYLNFYNTGKNLKLEAIWEKADENAKVNPLVVTFDAAGGSPVPEVQNVNAGESIYTPHPPVKEGYKFMFWKEKDIETDQAYIIFDAKIELNDSKNNYRLIVNNGFMDIPVANPKLELEAVWKQTKTFKVKFDTMGGEPTLDEKIIQSGSLVDEPALDPSKEGFTFIGWYDTKGKYNFGSPVERDFTLYAKYLKEGASHDKSNRQDIDIDDENYEKAIIHYKGVIFGGYPNNTFKPSEAISRAEMATVFARMLKLDEKKYTGKNQFSDIDNHWAKNNILKVAEYGLLKGYPDGTFKPNDKMKRGEITSIITKYWSVKEFQPNSNAINIKDVTKHWAKKLIYSLYNHRIVDLYSDGSFRPEAPLQRADLAQILNRITDRKLRKNLKQKFTDVPTSHWSFEEVNAASSDLN